MSNDCSDSNSYLFANLILTLEVLFVLLGICLRRSNDADLFVALVQISIISHDFGVVAKKVAGQQKKSCSMLDLLSETVDAILEPIHLFVYCLNIGFAWKRVPIMSVQILNIPFLITSFAATNNFLAFW